MIATRIALALIPTAVAIPVAVLATSSYNYLCARMDLLEGEVFEEGEERGRHFWRARVSAKGRFAELPALGLLVALGLTVLVKMFMPLSASFRPPTGFYVELASVRCEYDGDDRLIVLHITDAGKLLLNFEQERTGSIWQVACQLFTACDKTARFISLLTLASLFKL